MLIIGSIFGNQITFVSTICTNHFVIKLQIKLLTAKINNNKKITNRDKIDTVSRRDHPLEFNHAKTFTRRLFIFIKHFYKHFLSI